jgi:hypothetical protein
MSVKKDVKFGRSGGCMGIEEVLVVDILGRVRGGIELEAERGRPGGGRWEGDVEAAGFGVGEVERV